MTLATLSRDGHRDLVLLLHGMGSAKEIFTVFWDAPDFADMALLAPDLPGHGASQGFPPASSTMEGMAAAVGDLLRERAGAVERLQQRLGGRVRRRAQGDGGEVGGRPCAHRAWAAGQDER